MAGGYPVCPPQELLQEPPSTCAAPKMGSQTGVCCRPPAAQPKAAGWAFPAAYDRLEDLDPSSVFRIGNVDLHKEPERRNNIGLYYGILKDARELHVTTSCFSIWKQHQKTNGFAKVIPAQSVATDAEPVRVFFFDDNLEFNGREDSKGICNLRDASTGKFVDFCEGSNGFCRTQVSRHTTIHHSLLYRAVLVKANILDALESETYFIDIIKRFSTPDEKIIVFMDVNSTIMCNDTSANKDMSGSLLSTMLELMEAEPRAPFEFGLSEGADSTGSTVRVEARTSLKQLAKQLTGGDHAAYAAFWTLDTCISLLDRLAQFADVMWATHGGTVDGESFRSLYSTYLTSVSAGLGDTGITPSWFRCFESLSGSCHTVVLNSFGIDTRKVVLATVSDESRVMQMTVNFELWESRDSTRFMEQFHKLPPQGTGYRTLGPGIREHLPVLQACTCR